MNVVTPMHMQLLHLLLSTHLGQNLHADFANLQKLVAYHFSLLASIDTLCD